MWTLILHKLAATHPPWLIEKGSIFVIDEGNRIMFEVDVAMLRGWVSADVCKMSDHINIYC